ncbi:MAG: GNAT family N-acetyltransferase [Spirochaetaceae bacterium]|jgi:GNAT superfamily N-acetyltransferase|nr:GNAT family N-acetyltransferase [Spirochaetaceae bacterium]
MDHHRTKKILKNKDRQAVLTIRPAKARDSKSLTELALSSKAFWKYPKEYSVIWEKELTITKEYIEKNSVFVMELDGNMAAFYSMLCLEEDLPFKSEVLPAGVWLDHMFIKPDHILQGYGSLLYQHMVELGCHKEWHKIHILADPNAKGFYEKQGACYIKDVPSSIEGRSTPHLVVKLSKCF